MKSSEQEYLLKLVEAAFFNTDKPLSKQSLKQKLLSPYSVTNEQLDKIIEKIQEIYSERAIQLTRVATGYRFQINREFTDDLQRLSKIKTPKFSKALMETIALIAYQQPISRGEIEKIRGVSVSSQLFKTLVELQWIKISGYKDVPGKPALYKTTATFLDYFGLTSLNELPEILPIDDFA